MTSIRLNGSLAPSAETRLHAHLDAASKRSTNHRLLPLDIKIPVRTETFSPSECHRLGMDVCLQTRHRVFGDAASARIHHTLHLRGMPVIRFFEGPTDGAVEPDAPETHPDRPGDVPPRNRQEAIALLANLARIRFHVTTARSAHDCLARDRAQAARDAGRIDPSPLAFGEREIQAAMRIPYHARRPATFDECIRLLHIHAAPETLSPAWGRDLARDMQAAATSGA